MGNYIIHLSKKNRSKGKQQMEDQLVLFHLGFHLDLGCHLSLEQSKTLAVIQVATTLFLQMLDSDLNLG